MAYSVQTTFQINHTVLETLVLNAASNPQLTLNSFNHSESLSSTSTPAITKKIMAICTLSSGALTLNLASITDDTLGAVDLTGLKAHVVHIKNLGAASMTFAKGASNGHTGFGSAFSVVVPTGRHLVLSGSVAVGSGDRTIDVTGTGAQTFQLTILAGA